MPIRHIYRMFGQNFNINNIMEGILKKNSCERRDYESVDEKSLSWAMSRKTTKKWIQAQMGLFYVFYVNPLFSFIMFHYASPSFSFIMFHYVNPLFSLIMFQYASPLLSFSMSTNRFHSFGQLTHCFHS